MQAGPPHTPRRQRAHRMQQALARCEAEVALWQARYNVIALVPASRASRSGLQLRFPVTGMNNIVADMFDDIADLSDSQANYSLAVNGSGNVSILVVLRRERSHSPARPASGRPKPVFMPEILLAATIVALAAALVVVVLTHPFVRQAAAVTAAVAHKWGAGARNWSLWPLG